MLRLQSQQKHLARSRFFFKKHGADSVLRLFIYYYYYLKKKKKAHAKSPIVCNSVTLLRNANSPNP